MSGRVCKNAECDQEIIDKLPVGAIGIETLFA